MPGTKAHFIDPMLLLRTERLPEGPEWLMELFLRISAFSAQIMESKTRAYRATPDSRAGIEVFDLRPSASFRFQWPDNEGVGRANISQAFDFRKDDVNSSRGRRGSFGIRIDSSTVAQVRAMRTSPLFWRGFNTGTFHCVPWSNEANDQAFDWRVGSGVAQRGQRQGLVCR